MANQAMLCDLEIPGDLHYLRNLDTDTANSRKAGGGDKHPAVDVARLVRASTFPV